jgi:alkylation response protein AidB-like acyl-CoA dehydrogenase
LHVELTEEQEFFRSSIRKFLEAETPLTAIRDLYETPDGFDPAWWRQAAELGWTSLLVPSERGGGTLSGRPVADAVIVAEEMGRLVAPGPFLPVNVVAATIAAAGSDEQREMLLPDLLSGDAVAAWAFCEPGHRWEAPQITTTATPAGGDIVLHGAKAYVEAVASASHMLVSARTEAGLTQVLVPSDAEGVQITSGRSLDMTRRFGSVRFNEVRLPGDAVVGEVAGAAPRVAEQLRLALALQCAELVGIADRTLEFTLEYGAERLSFGRPIVSFQALKHRIADMYVRLEGAKAVTDALVSAIDAGSSDVDTLAHVAKAYVGTHVLDIVDDCVQITGGIGVTWEHDIHLYNRRAAVDRAVFGTPEDHKVQLLQQLKSSGSQA